MHIFCLKSVGFYPSFSQLSVLGLFNWYCCDGVILGEGTFWRTDSWSSWQNKREVRVYISSWRSLSFLFHQQVTLSWNYRLWSTFCPLYIPRRARKRRLACHFASSYFVIWGLFTRDLTFYYDTTEHFKPLFEHIGQLEEALYNIQFEQHWLEAQTDRQAIGISFCIFLIYNSPTFQQIKILPITYHF